MNWQRHLDYDCVGALLAHDDPAITHYLRRDLLGESVDSIELVWEQAGPRRLLSKQQDDGSWKGPAKKVPVYPDNHSDLMATFKQVRLLIERYEMTKDAEPMALAAEYLLSFQTGDGDLRGFIGNQYATYYTGYVLSLLIRAGLADDSRIHHGMQWLLRMRQDDGGWTIPILTHTFDRQTGYDLTATFMDPIEPDRTKPFSHNWTDMVLRAFAAHPDYRSSKEAAHAGLLLKSQFFEPDAYGSYRDPKYWTRFGFWWPNLLTAMESLCRLGFSPQDPDMQRGIEWFLSNQAPDGLWKITNDGSAEPDTPTSRRRRAWLTLRICRLITDLE